MASEKLEEFLKRDSSTVQEQEINTLVQEFGKIDTRHGFDIGAYKGAAEILQKDPGELAPYIFQLMTLIFRIRKLAVARGKEVMQAMMKEPPDYGAMRAVYAKYDWVPIDGGAALGILLRKILRKKLPLEYDHVAELCFYASVFTKPDELPWFDGKPYGYLPPGYVVQALEAYDDAHDIDEVLKLRIQDLKSACASGKWEGSNPKIEARLAALLGLGEQLKPDSELKKGDPWAAKALADLDSMNEAERGSWEKLLEHAFTAEQTRPPKRWMKEAKGLIGEIGGDEFRQKMITWLPLVKENSDRVLRAKNSAALKGFVWACGVNPDADSTRLVGDVCEAAFKKIPEIGARSTKVGNACITILAETGGTEAVGQLVRLKQRVRYRSAKSLIDRTLSRVAEREGLTPDALEELALPDFGLTGAGELREAFGEFTAKAKIVGTDKMELAWVRPDGKPQKTVPKSVREDHGEGLKAFKKNVRDIEKFLLGQRGRIERFCLTDPVWKVKDWRQFYLDHPLLANMTRRLIWDFREGELSSGGILQDDAFVNELGEKIEWITDETEVRLWHPLGQPTDLVRAWRQRIAQDEIVQPFKQAHREIYVLTDAERETRIYSNRFAAHILRQHQMAALMKERNWAYGLQGMWDGDSRPTLKLPNAPISAEFWVEPVVDEDQVSDSGVCLYVATDQVRFCDLESREPVVLDSIPGRIFSEVFREVDLFVSVSSVGNDPAWVDSGERAAAHREYWEAYAFGDLTQSAQTRRDALEQILPRLKIAKKCKIDGKFLIVQGDLRTYKIHLGSGNIQMEPNNQYLCIVAGWKKGASAPRSLPYEGDRKFEEILSKAFMLAEDKKIKDKMILNQIHGRGAFE